MHLHKEKLELGRGSRDGEMDETAIFLEGYFSADFGGK